MKRTISFSLLIFFIFNLFAQEKETHLYAVKDTSKLYMDVYVPKVQNEQQGCLFFVFGGGFIGGKRDDNQIQKVKEYFTEKGYVVIAIDYRLGMRGQKNFSALASVKRFDYAIQMAAEDLISSIDYTLKNLMVPSNPALLAFEQIAALRVEPDIKLRCFPVYTIVSCRYLRRHNLLHVVRSCIRSAVDRKDSREQIMIVTIHLLHPMRIK